MRPDPTVSDYEHSPTYPRHRFFYTALEPIRFPFELVSSKLSSHLLAQRPKGDGHPVMVLPPFLASDQITQTLRDQIQRWGYEVQGWDLGINSQTRNSDSIAEALTQRKLVSKKLAEIVHDIAERSGQAVSLVGWSLGGLHALEIAQAIPAAVRQIITLGSPLGDPRATAIYALMNATGSQESTNDGVAQWLHGLDAPLMSVPFTSVYSDSDGIIDPAIAEISAGPLRQNIRVNSTHLGMAFNTRVYFVLENRLQMDAQTWQPMETPSWLNWPL